MRGWWTKRAGGAAPGQYGGPIGEFGGLAAGRALTPVTSSRLRIWDRLPDGQSAAPRGRPCDRSCTIRSPSRDIGIFSGRGRIFSCPARATLALCAACMPAPSGLRSTEGAPSRASPEDGFQQRRGRSPRRCSRNSRTAVSRAVCMPISPRCRSRSVSRKAACPNGRRAFRERIGVIGCRSNAGHASCCPHAAVSGSQWLRTSGPGEHRQGVPRSGHRTLHLGICSRGRAWRFTRLVGVGSAGGNAQ